MSFWNSFPQNMQGDSKNMPIDYFFGESIQLNSPKFELNLFRDGWSNFGVGFWLYQVSKNRELNSQKMGWNSIVWFYDLKHILNLTFFIDKNNVFTLIWIFWIRFSNQFRHNSAHNASKLTWNIWKSINFAFFLFFDEQSWWRVKFAG